VCFQLLRRPAPDQTVDLMLIEWEACRLEPTSLASLPLLQHSQPILSTIAGPADQPPPLGDDTEVCTPVPAQVVDAVLAASTTPLPVDPSTPSGQVGRVLVGTLRLAQLQDVSTSSWASTCPRSSHSPHRPCLLPDYRCVAAEQHTVDF
jgi:hypothetical protein